MSVCLMTPCRKPVCNRWTVAAPLLLLAVLTAGLALAGCGRRGPPNDQGASSANDAILAEPAAAPVAAEAVAKGDEATVAHRDAPPEKAQGAEPPKRAADQPLLTSPSTSPPTTNNASAAASPNVENGPAAGNETSVDADTRPVQPARAPPRPTSQQLTSWNLVDYEPLKLLACYDGFADGMVQSLAVSPVGKQFALGGARLTLWTTTEPQPTVDLLSGYKDSDIERPIRAVAISPDGKWLAAGDQKGMLRIWNLNDRKEALAIEAHDARLVRLAFSPNSKLVATTSYSGEVRLWQVADGKMRKSIRVASQEIKHLLFVNDQILAAAADEVSLWNIDGGQKRSPPITGRLLSPALGLSVDRQLLAYSDGDGQLHVWNTEKHNANEIVLQGGGNGAIEFSHDGKWIAAFSSDLTIRVWDTATGQLMQVIDADGARTAALKWLPQASLMAIASENGRMRIWGTPEAARAAGLPPLVLPTIAAAPAESDKPFTSAQLEQVIDIRSFPRLPGGVAQWTTSSMVSYTAPAEVKDAELFYRYCAGKAGWQEVTNSSQGQPGLSFSKSGCLLNVSLTPAATSAAGGSAALQVSLNLAGNYDVRRISKVWPIDSKATYETRSLVSYRTKAALTDIEAALLQQCHAAGWTGYTRLAASSNEEVESRMISMLQGASTLTISISRPADAADQFAVQISAGIADKSLPIPPDSGWIEFDSSVNLQQVANTKLGLQPTVAFYDQAMAAEGWMAREADRRIEATKAWLPYIRGQRDVLIRLVTLEDGRTRAIVGEAETSSWQLAQPAAAESQPTNAGIEAADYPLPKSAHDLKFDVDQKQITFSVPDITPAKLAEQTAEQLKATGWTRENSGVVSDEYTLATFKNGRAEVQLRGRLVDGKNTSAIVSGDELLWSKPLPTAPVRVSYATWLRRHRYDATLDRLPEFVEEMHKIPEAGGASK